MNWMQRRRMALMGVKSGEISLVNGSYSNGFIVVSNGNGITISGSIANYTDVQLPLTSPINVNVDDVLSYKLSNKTGTDGKAYNVGFLVNNTVVKNAQDRPGLDIWYSKTNTVDGNITAIVFQNRTGGATVWDASFEISIKINDEVIF